VGALPPSASPVGPGPWLRRRDLPSLPDPGGAVRLGLRRSASPSRCRGRRGRSPGRRRSRSRSGP
jgi:hypothetical protein